MSFAGPRLHWIGKTGPGSLTRRGIAMSIITEFPGFMLLLSLLYSSLPSFMYAKTEKGPVLSINKAQ